MKLKNIMYLILIAGCIFPFAAAELKTEVSNLESETIYSVDNNIVSSTTTTTASIAKAIKQQTKISKNKKTKKTITIKEQTASNKIVYEGLTMKQLTKKLNKSLNSTLAGTGESFAKYALQKNVDVYTAVAIVLLETGCKWSCSAQVKKCNNVGGMKGSGSCQGTSYASFNSLDEGIQAYINNLSKNYYKVGLNTPELMNSKYAASSTWAIKVNNYINQIKSA